MTPEEDQGPKETGKFTPKAARLALQAWAGELESGNETRSEEDRRKEKLLLSTISGLGWSQSSETPLSLLTSGAPGNHESVVKAFQKTMPTEWHMLVSTKPCPPKPPIFLLGGSTGEILAGLPHRHYGDKLRPGSGIVRVVDGHEKGPSGTLTCFLSSADGGDLYFLAASHVLSNYWHDRANGGKADSIYRNIRGYPSAARPRSLGSVYKHSFPSTCAEVAEKAKSVQRKDKDLFYPDHDAGLVSLKNDFFQVVQRTTCYGSLGPLPASEPDYRKNLLVTKCGAEEPHGGCARVLCRLPLIHVHGPNEDEDGEDHVYCFKDQILLSTNPKDFGQPQCDCGCKPCRCSQLIEPDGIHDHRFAAPGDSGTLIVDYKTRVPLGMLIAGSVLTGYYVMTPIETLKTFWEGEGLIFRRA